MGANYSLLPKEGNIENSLSFLDNYRRKLTELDINNKVIYIYNKRNEYIMIYICIDGSIVHLKDIKTGKIYQVENGTFFCMERDLSRLEQIRLNNYRHS